MNTRMSIKQNSKSSNEILLIETEEMLQNICVLLRQQKKIAVDLEGNSLHHYQENISLIQVSIKGSDFIIDPLKISNLSPLFDIFIDPSIQKIMHGSDFDVMSLQRDFNIKIKNLFDTQIAAYMLGLEGLSLASLLEHYFSVELEKALQKHDWSFRPLDRDHLEYARNDTHWLLALQEILVHQLQSEQLIDAVLEECTILSNKEFVDRRNEETAFLRVKGSQKLSPNQKKRLYFIWSFRENCAKERDLPTFKVFSDSQIVSLCQTTEINRAIISKILGTKNFIRYGDNILSIIENADISTLVLPEYPKLTIPKVYGQEIIINQLKEWRTKKKDTNIRISLLPTNQQLKDISQAKVQSKADISKNMRNWQFQMWGDEIWNTLEPHIQKLYSKKKKSKT